MPDKISILIFILVGTFLSISTDLTYIEAASVAFFIGFLIYFIKNFGSTIWLVPDLIVILASITWLITPLFFYHFFTNENELANIWGKSMPIDSNTYYSFVFPATLALAFGLHWPFSKKIHFNYSLASLRKEGYFERPNKLAYQLISISFIASLLRPFIPSDFAYFFGLFEKLFLLGLFYLFFSGNRPKIYILIIGAAILIMNSIRSGMFGELVYMLTIASIILSLGSRYSMRKKLYIIVAGFLIVVLIQSVKNDYRKVAWSTGSDASLFSTLIIDRILDPSLILNKEVLFGIAVRFNQGWLIAGTMSNVPAIIPFAHGETIWQAIEAIAIPRFLWPEKPTAGGKANLERFLNIKDISYSMNLGPIGEGYVNFGVIGGIIFIFLYGLFFRWIFNNLLKVILKAPTLIFWIPLMFFYAISVETDMLITINSLVKTIVFVYLLWKVYPIIFKLKL